MALVLSLTVTSCNLISESKKIDYKSAGKLPALDIPPDLITPATDERYLIPDLNATGSATYSAYHNERGGQPRTGFSSLLPVSDKDIHIERAGTQRWLVVPQTPEAVWPKIKEFWQELGFLIKLEVPETGIMETDWAENRAKLPQDYIRSILSTLLDSLYSTAERDKFRTRLERGETGTTEIYISHRGMDEVIEGGSTQRTIWQPRPADPDLEAEMLSRLMIYFGVAEENAKLELATVSNTTRERAYIDREQENILIVNQAFDRSWRRVGLALDRIGFTVEDRNRLEGIYYVRYVNPETDSHKSGDDDGILSGLMFWRKDTTDIKAIKYRIQVSETGTNSSKVVVLNESGLSAKSDTTDRIIKLLYEQLK
ncbi:Beta-barrel assembly machine subunit BamC [Nitrosomonas cryotolerans]|uniref:Beta-barrel assembly machine subunit BamC n=1 Tax=Nitrosomonas cryotolerans ATCC 49181 TaxID=1131553 RepID=A0A1N6H964_9PROT|nr:outer membrane protein assembly factor BamC [Nitrosomonas cryotolerans]SFP80051.1 Beta-barrel assembly machine subunit BamC [Nitrosomonas cryotolerans]SIO16296.1 Beta-barrel assembly machine subunit BamC [Nitrosomonas cryotolerans ATCC 49181]